MAVAGVCHSNDHFATGKTVPSAESVRVGALRQVGPESLDFCWSLVREHENMARQVAYARKMEPDPEEIPDFSPFIKMRRIQLDPDSVIGKELLDRFAEFDDSFTGHSRIWAVVVKLIGLTAMCSKAVIDLEKQVIDLRRELRSRDKA